MKRNLLVIALLISIHSFSQKEESFKPGVRVAKFEKESNYKTPQSILFIFSGDTHLVNYFLDLEKRIRKEFKKKKNRKSKGLKMNFDYDLKGVHPLKSDLKKIPTKSYLKNKYESIAFVTISNVKGWDNQLHKKRKQHYNLNIELKNNNSETLLSLELRVNTFHTILTQNKNLSELICEKIMMN